MPINKILAEYLDQYHKGEANAVTSRELEYAFGMRGSELRRALCALSVSLFAALRADTTMPLPQRKFAAPPFSFKAASTRSPQQRVV